MPQLSIADRTFIVKTFYETGSLQQARNQFRERFPERQNLALSTIWYNVRKFEQNGTSLNRNKGNSGRRRTDRSAENIELVRNRLAEHPTGTSARRHGVGIPSATFNRIRFEATPILHARTACIVTTRFSKTAKFRKVVNRAMQKK